MAIPHRRGRVVGNRLVPGRRQSAEAILDRLRRLYSRRWLDRSRSHEFASLQGLSSIVRVVLQEPRQALEVGSALDEADHGYERLGVDQLLEGDVVEVQLAGDRDQDAVEVVLDE